jgi:hypothetical protein
VRANIVAFLLLVLSAAAGYAFATWGPLARRPSSVEQICSRVDYMDGLHRKMKASEGPFNELRDEFRAVAGQCRDALSGRSQENE